MISERIKQLREEENCSQAELAKKINISQSSLGNYERGDRIPDAETIVAIAQHFNVSADYLLGISKDRHRTPAAADELGLSEKSIHELKQLHPHEKNLIVDILENDTSRADFRRLAFSIHCAKDTICRIVESGIYFTVEAENEAMKSAEYIREQLHNRYPISIISGHRSVELDIFEACSMFERILKEHIGYIDFRKYSIDRIKSFLDQSDKLDDEYTEYLEDI